MPHYLISEKFTSVRVKAWSRVGQATIHYLGQCWSIFMLPYGVSGQQWVNFSDPYPLFWFFSSSEAGWGPGYTLPRVRGTSRGCLPTILIPNMCELSFLFCFVSNVLMQGGLSTATALLPVAGLNLGLRHANERRRYKVTPSLIGWA